MAQNSSGVDVEGARATTRAMIKAAGADVSRLKPKPYYECEHCGNTVDAALVEPIIRVPVVDGAHVLMRDALLICEGDGYAMRLVTS